MTGSGREGIIPDWLKSVQPTSVRSYNHNTSEDTARPRTSGLSRAIRGLDNWRSRKTPQAEQPDRKRRSPIKDLFSRSGAGERSSKISRSHITPSPEQEAAIPLPKSPPRRPFNWSSRGTRDFAARANASQSELQAVSELRDLIELQTANPAYTLKRLAGCELQLKRNDAHRTYLLETARLAVQVAHGEFNRASRAARQRVCKEGCGRAFNHAPTVRFADATDLKTFAGEARNVADGLDNGLSDFEIFRNLGMQCRRAAAELKNLVESVTRGGPAAEMMEIRWMVERKCMYLDAIAMMNARIGEAGRVRGESRRLRRHSE